MADDHMPEGWFAVGTTLTWLDGNNVTVYVTGHIEYSIKNRRSDPPDRHTFDGPHLVSSQADSDTRDRFAVGKWTFSFDSAR